jgi:hypothetical protein
MDYRLHPFQRFDIDMAEYSVTVSRILPGRRGFAGLAAIWQHIAARTPDRKNETGPAPLLNV